jgi:hypothetical protein
MKIPNLIAKISTSTFLVSTAILTFGTKSSFAELGPQCDHGLDENGNPCIKVDQSPTGLNFHPPTLAQILTFAIRLIFIIGGLAALVMLLLGAFSWITSGGEKDKVQAAQQKIQAAVLGVIMIAVVLAVVVTLEQVVFAGRICLGLSCGITIPSLLK